MLAVAFLLCDRQHKDIGRLHLPAGVDIHSPGEGEDHSRAEEAAVAAAVGAECCLYRKEDGG